MTSTPRDAAQHEEETARRTPGPDERLAGYGVLGLPFASGHVLAFRRFPSTPFAQGYRSVWHRDPSGRWTLYVDRPASESCPRWFDAAVERSVRSDVAIAWQGPWRLTVEVPGLITWSMDLTATRATTLLSRTAAVMPERSWDSPIVLGAMGPMAGTMLRAGRIRLAGTMPNGQWFRTAPRMVWAVDRSTAVVDGVDLGGPQALPVQAGLGDYPLPQRGLFMVGRLVCEALDPTRHVVARPALARVHR